MTTADELREEGRKVGLEEGRKVGLEEGRKVGLEEGRKEAAAIVFRRVLSAQLSYKFEDVPAWVMQTVQTASVENLERWMVNILRKNSVEDIFA